MFRAVDTVFTNHEVDWNPLPAFTSAVSELRANLLLIDQVAHQQDSATVGVKTAKDQAHLVAVERAEFIANALRAYAAANGTTALREQLRFSETDLLNSSVNVILQLFARIQENALLYGDALADYGIVEQDLDAFAQLCTDLPGILTSTRHAIVNRSQQLETLQELIASTNHLLREVLDPQVKMLRSSHPDFFKLYTHARTVVDYKGKSTRPRVPGGANDAPPAGD